MDYEKMEAALNEAFDSVMGAGSSAPTFWPARNPQRKPVVIRGIRYGSRTDAAEHLGVTKSAVCQAVANGSLATVGLQKKHAQKELK